MALYYLNKSGNTTVLYTDTSSLFHLLRFAEPNEYVSIPYLVARHRRTQKLFYHRNGNSTGEIKGCIHDYLPASVQLNLLYDSDVIPKDFVIKFAKDITAYTDRGEMIVRLKSEDRLMDLLERLDVPARLFPALMSSPGMLFNCVLRNGAFEEYGYFNQIEDWLNLRKYEKRLRRLGIMINEN